MKSVIAALIPMLLLSGCATAPFNGLACPDVIQYGRQTQNKAAVEIGAGSAPVMTEMMKDYGVMRDQARACKAGGKP